MYNSYNVRKDLNQGILPIGVPKAYNFDYGVIETARAEVNQGMVKINAGVQLVNHMANTGVENINTAKVNALSDINSAKNTATISINNLGNSIINQIKHGYGYPFVASTVADMTDQTKIYVYTGSETGYTNGDWYYYDGTAWVSGGVYNATALETDKTLTVSGAAADAQITGTIRSTTKNCLQYFDNDISLWEVGNITAQSAWTNDDLYVRTSGGIRSYGKIIISAQRGYEISVVTYNLSGQFVAKSDFANFYQANTDQLYCIVVKESTGAVHHEDAYISRYVEIIITGKKEYNYDITEEFSVGVPIDFIAGRSLNTPSVGSVIDLSSASRALFMAYAIVDVTDCEGLLLNVKGGSSPRAFAFIDSSNVVLSTAPDVYQAENLYIKIPYGATKCIINSSNTYLGNCYKITSKYYKSILNNNTLLDMRKVSTGIPIEFTIGFNVDTNTGVGNVISLTPRYSGIANSYAIVDVTDCEGLLLNVKGGSSPRAYAFIDNNNTIINVAPDTYQVDNLYLKVPFGASKCVLNSFVANLGDCYKVTNINYRELVNDTAINTLNDTDSYMYQIDNLIKCIGAANFNEKILTVAEPDKYNCWPFVVPINNKLLCLYTIGDNHFDMESGTYYKNSPNGIVWSAPKKLMNTPNRRENVTGKGNDLSGNVLFWERITNQGATYFECIKYDGESFETISQVNFSYVFAHVADIICVEDNLLCFYNTYGESREYGILKSTDNGVTWTKTTIESDLSAIDCPTEIQGAYLGDGRILAIGRKDAWDTSSYKQFQLQSSDSGATWSKEYTNIGDITESTTSVIFDSTEQKIYLYYYDRSFGKLYTRSDLVENVWNRPTNWSASEIVATGTRDGGNANATKFNNKKVVAYYSGESTSNGVYCVLL